MSSPSSAVTRAVVLCAILGALVIAGIGLARLGTAPSTSSAPGRTAGSATPDRSVSVTASPSVATQAPSAAATVAAEPLTYEAAVSAAESTLSRFLATSDQILQKADGDAGVARTMASGFVLGEIEAAAQERKDVGLRQTGSVRIVSMTPRVVRLDVTNPTVSISACLDVSGIDVIDSTGASLKDRLYQPSGPVQHVYGVGLVAGVWLVTTHSIPDSNDCPR
jgi:hypothetical protein